MRGRLCQDVTGVCIQLGPLPMAFPAALCGVMTLLPSFAALAGLMLCNAQGASLKPFSFAMLSARCKIQRAFTCQDMLCSGGRLIARANVGLCAGQNRCQPHYGCWLL